MKDARKSQSIVNADERGIPVRDNAEKFEARTLTRSRVHVPCVVCARARAHRAYPFFPSFPSCAANFRKACVDVDLPPPLPRGSLRHTGRHSPSHSFSLSRGRARRKMRARLNTLAQIREM